MSTKAPSARRRHRSAIDRASLPDFMRQHLARLELETVEDYLAWCRAHGFKHTYAKSRREVRAEALHAVRATATRALRDVRRLRRPDRLLRRLLAGEAVELPPELSAVRELACERRSDAERAFADRLLAQVAKACPDLLFECVGTGGARDGIYLQALLRIVEHHGSAVRDVERWRPRCHNARRRFGTLVRHLFARWPVPGFMEAAWLDDGDEAEHHRRWYVHLGAGRSLRGAEGLPFPPTKKAVPASLRAPSELTIAEALRWGQCVALGDDGRVARALRGTRLCEDFGHNAFWTSVLEFFIRERDWEPHQLGPIVDYLHHQRFVGRELIDGRGSIVREPPAQPRLSMRGRTMPALLRQMEAWHRELARGDDPRLCWPASDVSPFEWAEGAGESARTWTIRELRSSGQLRAEGRAMSHCVAIYARACRSGSVSIWTLERASATGIEKVLTIEVRNRRRCIVQARGRFNELPDEASRAVLRRWANVAGLTVLPYL